MVINVLVILMAQHIGINVPDEKRLKHILSQLSVVQVFQLKQLIIVFKELFVKLVNSNCRL